MPLKKSINNSVLSRTKSRIKKRVLLKNVKHDEGFPTFQKKILHIKAGIWNNVLLPYPRHYTTHLELTAHLVKSPFFEQFFE